MKFRLKNADRLSVSVVIPCFQSQDCIDRALRSVLAQTLIPEEIILVDDGNPPDFFSRIRAFQEESLPLSIRLIANAENSGPSFSRNRGWDAAQGDLIAFLDHDDAWHPHKLAWQVHCFHRHPNIAFAAHRSVCVDVSHIPEPWTKEIPTVPITWSALSRSNFFSTPTVMLRREIPLRFQRQYRYGEDYDLWMRLVLAGFPGMFGDAPLTFLFKDRFGAGGLSGDLWKMERGIQRVFRNLGRDRLISPWQTRGLRLYAALKFIRRLAIRQFLPALSR